MHIAQTWIQMIKGDLAEISALSIRCTSMYDAYIVSVYLEYTGVAGELQLLHHPTGQEVSQGYVARRSQHLPHK